MNSKKIWLNFFQAQDEEEHQDYLDQELWIKENFTEWKQEKDDEMRAKMVQSGRYKQYKRYMRNHGPDRMTFDDSWFYLKFFKKTLFFCDGCVHFRIINFQSFQNIINFCFILKWNHLQKKVNNFFPKQYFLISKLLFRKKWFVLDEIDCLLKCFKICCIFGIRKP